MNYTEEIKKLVGKHRLSFFHNPGGGVFSFPGLGLLQVPFMDPKEDYELLVAWLKEEKGIDVNANCA